MTQPVSRICRSFWIAGFEAACHVNRHGVRLDLVAATQHDLEIQADYRRVAETGFLTVREGMRWHLIERGGAYDFGSVVPMLRAARRAGIQVIWSLFHYGWPEGLELLSPEFVRRFARYCAAAARVVAGETGDAPLYIPVNEISYVAWAAGEEGYIYPDGKGRGATVKRQLVRAAVAAMEAILDVDPRARFVHVDPLIHVVPPRDRPELAGAAAEYRAAQFHAWDMIAGRSCPELGGRSRYLDIVGANFYHANQFEYPDQRLRWEDEPRDPRWVPLRHLLAELHQRYGRPLLIGETSHFGSGRGRWIREVADEVRAARADGVPVEGLCVYPIIDRPDWDDPGHWHHSGLWELRRGEDDRLERVACLEYVEELRRARAALEPSPPAPERRLASSGSGPAPAPAPFG
ncbi:family 1 glycosylhydrolase [soil metagenome]